MEKPKQITEQSHSIPVAGEADVIVVGGGVAGVAAAVSAARNGSRVILLASSWAVWLPWAMSASICLWMTVWGTRYMAA